MKGKETGPTKPATGSRYSSTALRFHLIALFLTTLFLSKVNAQDTSPEAWLVPGQTYLRIPIAQTGFYTILGQELRQAGLPIETIPSHTVQIFRRGKELSIEVNGNNDGNLSDNSTISFFGKPNDGLLDSALYIHPKAMAHKKYSLYSDTAVYFLTWRLDGLPGKRIEIAESTTPLDTLPYHLQEKEEVFNSHYHIGNFYPPGSGFNNGIARTEYDMGEGWTGRPLQREWQTIDVNTSGLHKDLIDQCEIEMVLTGRSVGKHVVEIWTGTESNRGRRITSLNLTDSEPATVLFNLQATDTSYTVLNNGKMAISIFAEKGTSSLSYVKWRYPQKTGFSFSDPYKIFHFSPIHHHFLWPTGNNGQTQFYDISDTEHPQIFKDIHGGIAISNSRQIIGINKKMEIKGMRRVHLSPTDSLLGNYLIISHPAIRSTKQGNDPVAEYAAYRSSAKGGGYKVSVINIEEIFNRFNYGEASPQAIRNLILRHYKVNPLKFIFMIGHSTDPQTARKRPDARNVDMIPNAGWPGSDLALAIFPEIDSTLSPVISIGRINAKTGEEVSVYLKKVMDLEAQPASAPWRQNILHLTGGRSLDEIETFKSYAQSFENTVTKSSLAPHIETVSKQTERDVEQVTAERYINRGTALMTIFGHSSINVTDMDIGFVSDPDRAYQNHPFYPAVIANGCALGSIFYSDYTISSDWIFAPNKGAILFLAHTFNGPSTALNHYTNSFYQVLADSSFTSAPFGTIQLEAIRRNLKLHTTLADKITAQQMNLHGDPAIRIFPGALPDYAFDSSAFAYSDITEQQATTWSDSIKIRLVIKNNGRFKEQPYTLRVQSENGKVVYQTRRNPVFISDSLVFHIKNPLSTNLTFILDANQECAEESEDNNFYQLNLILPEGGAFPILPFNGYKTSTRQVDLIAQLANPLEHQQIIFEWASDSSFTAPRQKTAKVHRYTASVELTIENNWQTVYWRVFLDEYPSKKSSIRSITYRPGIEQTIQVPEGLAFLNTSYPTHIQEGDTLQLEAAFQNITKTPFTDSVAVYIQHSTPYTIQAYTRHIASPKANETGTIFLALPTAGLPGKHHITFSFNSDHLPEADYDNDIVRASYEVLADKLPPIVTVYVDGRLLRNGDIVSQKPNFKIQITDENKFKIRKDTAGIEVYLQENGWLSPEKRISLTGATTQTNLFNVYQLNFSDIATLAPAHYTLRVKARDLSGNIAPTYRIMFKIENSFAAETVTVAPNPSASYFRFSFFTPQQIPGKTIDLVIRNVYGTMVHKQRLAPHIGINELLWSPNELPSGIYFYRFETEDDKRHSHFMRNKQLQGKVVWVR